MAVIMESNGISIIPINPGCGYDGSAKITTNIFRNDFRVAEIGLGIDIETMFVLAALHGARSRHHCNRLRKGDSGCEDSI